MYNLVTNSKNLFNNEQEYKTRDPVSTNQSTLENVINYLKQYQLDREIQLSDINKHQHMSCLSGKDGLSLGLLGLTVGAGKEIAEFSKNLSVHNKEKHMVVLAVYLQTVLKI